MEIKLWCHLWHSFCSHLITRTGQYSSIHKYFHLMQLYSSTSGARRKCFSMFLMHLTLQQHINKDAFNYSTFTLHEVRDESLGNDLTWCKKYNNYRDSYPSLQRPGKCKEGWDMLEKRRKATFTQAGCDSFLFFFFYFSRSVWTQKSDLFYSELSCFPMWSKIVHISNSWPCNMNENNQIPFGLLHRIINNKIIFNSYRT